MANSASKTSVPGVYKRAKSYACVVSTGRDSETGRWRQQWVGEFRTIAEAKAARQVAMNKVCEGTYVPQSQLTRSEFIEEQWLPAQTMRVRPADAQSLLGELATGEASARERETPSGRSGRSLPFLAK